MKKLLFVAIMMVAGTIFSTSNAHTAVRSADDFGGAYLVFADKFGGDLTPAQIAKQKSIGVKGCAEGSRIFKFTLHVKKNGRTTKFSGTSPQLTTEMQNALTSLKKGDEFVFKNVKANLPRDKGEVDVWGKPFYVV